MQTHNFTHKELLELSADELDKIVESEVSVLDVNKIYHYQSKEHVHKFIQDIRSFPLDGTEFYMYLGNDILIKDTRARCLINALITVVLDNYEVHPSIRKEFVFTKTYNNDEPIKYMNNILYHLRRVPIINEQVFLPHLLSDIKQPFYLLAIIVNGVVSMDHSMYDYLKAYERNPEYRQIIDNPAYDYTMTPMDINEKTKYLGGMLENDILVDPLTDFFKAGIKINKQQVQSLFSYGFIPNPISSHLKSMIKPIVGGFLNGFLTKYDQYAVDLMGVIALHRGKAEVKEPGLINKRLTTALSVVRLNRVDTREKVHDCYSDRYFNIHIKDKSDLSFFRYKFFKPIDGKKNPRSPKPEYDFIDTDRTDLIGKTLQVRSIMLCDSDDVICETCTGYNYKFFQDNSIHKNHLGNMVATKLSDIIQKTISIKHHLSAKYLKLTFIFNGMQYSLQQLIDNNIVVAVAYDVVFFNPKLNINFIHHEKDKQKSIYGDVYINNVKLESDTLLERIHNNLPIFRMIMPNNTVMTEAVKLFEAIVSHDKVDYKTGKPPFDPNLLNGKNVNEQLWVIYEYIKSKLSLPHFIYYEAMVYAFGKDSEHIQERASRNTKHVVFAGVSDIITNPAKNPSISTGLVHGYVKSAMGLLNPGNKPSEFDLLYQPIAERKSTEDTLYSDLTKLMNE